MIYKYKQVILIRKDIKMGVGKIAAQASHASIYSVMMSDEKIVDEWLNEGMRKIVLKVDSQEELINLEKILEENNIKSLIVMDAGNTQIPAHTITAMGIEILESDKIDKFISKYKLL